MMMVCKRCRLPVTDDPAAKAREATCRCLGNSAKARKDLATIRRLLIHCPGCGRKAQIPIICDGLASAGFYYDSLSCVCGSGHAVKITMTEPMEVATATNGPVKPSPIDPYQAVPLGMSEQHAFSLGEMVRWFRDLIDTAKLPPSPGRATDLTVAYCDELLLALKTERVRS